MRKFWFGVVTILALLGGVAVTTVLNAPIEAYSTYAWAVFFTSATYVTGNAVVHATRAFEAVNKNAIKPTNPPAP